MTNEKSSVDTFILLYSKGRDENRVAVWGREEDTKPDGSKETTDLQEIWRINKDGK